MVTGHGVDPALPERLFQLGGEFFNLPMEEKLKVKGTPFRGFNPVGAEYFGYDRANRDHRNQRPGDLREAFSAGPMEFPDDEYHRSAEAKIHLAPNLWPARPVQFRATLTAYYQRLATLAADLMRMFAVALDLPESFFDHMLSNHSSAVRIMNYPNQPEAPLPGQVRAGAHSDPAR